MLKPNTANFGGQVCLQQTENGMIPLSYMEICLADLCIARQIGTLLLNRIGRVMCHTGQVVSKCCTFDFYLKVHESEFPQLYSMALGSWHHRASYMERLSED